MRAMCVDIDHFVKKDWSMRPEFREFIERFFDRRRKENFLFVVSSSDVSSFGGILELSKVLGLDARYSNIALCDMVSNIIPNIEESVLDAFRIALVQEHYQEYSFVIVFSNTLWYKTIAKDLCKTFGFSQVPIPEHKRLVYLKTY